MTHTAMTPETEMALRAMCDACTAVQTAIHKYNATVPGTAEHEYAESAVLGSRSAWKLAAREYNAALAWEGTAYVAAAARKAAR